jgi:flagellar hook-basal body complex protein FliE
MKINDFNPAQLVNINTKSNVNNFETFFKQKLDNLNSEQLKSEVNISEISTGKSENLQKAILQIDKAEMELKFALEVRNKLLDSYKQVIQTQI